MRYGKRKNTIFEQNLHFGLRLNFLFYRCRSAFLIELIRISEYLLKIFDQSYQSRIIAESLRRTVIIHGKENIRALDGLISACGPKALWCLEAESRLLQLNFYCLVMRAARLNSVQGRELMKDDIFVVSGLEVVKLEEHEDLSSVKVDLKGSLERIFSLCRRFPLSAGRYLGQAKNMQEEVFVNFNAAYLFTSGTRLADHSWGRDIPRSISRCMNGHVYPSGIETCPECGPEKSLDEEINQERNVSTAQFESLLKMR